MTHLAPAHTDTGANAAFDVEVVRRDFPVLSRQVHGKPLVYLDSGASAQKPRQVLDTMRAVYDWEYANVHRGAYFLSQQATRRYEDARGTVARFIGAASPDEIVFTRGATEAINLVAQTFGRANLTAGDEIVITALEHHSNIVPWQMLRDEKGLVLKVVPVGDDGSVSLEDVAAALSERTRLVAVAHVSNVLGTVLPVKEIAEMAHKIGATVLLDGCQGVVHLPVDVAELGCDFYVFSGHKLYGPTGIGVLWGRHELLAAMPPWQGGGDMIASVTFEKSTWAEPPARFEAGTPAIVQAIGLAAAMEWLDDLDRAAVHAHESALMAHAMQTLGALDGITLFGTTPGKAAVIAFAVDGAHPHDVAALLDRQGICVRAGHHCAEPLMGRFGVPGMVRASLGLYNHRQDIDALAAGLTKARQMLA
ncbi:aminotransferase class V-fold PLP-dependent enzyme [Roseospirillum parvum]|uniref:Cysteine desulfurase n=1 Tax=Roseospirillum parvum TaxID=83401 RepID=A0A1G7ULA4_9PROT|nr:cysteine desulfurase [Roseospirillum parvum]SDG47510.1 cysteine desulfurase / selenocysteine lyase [Roseospirillum parvum]